MSTYLLNVFFFANSSVRRLIKMKLCNPKGYVREGEKD
jgi:hypothetical protein